MAIYIPVCAQGDMHSRMHAHGDMYSRAWRYAFPYARAWRYAFVSLLARGTYVYPNGQGMHRVPVTCVRFIAEDSPRVLSGA